MTTNNFIRKLFKESKGISMDKERKNSIRNEILSFMKEHPLEKADRKLHPMRVKFGMAVFLSIFLAGGVMTARAESALPGEILYLVKLGVNERVESFFAFSDESKARLNIQLANRRFQEAEKLIIQKRINNKNCQQIRDGFLEHAQAIEDCVNKFNDNEMHGIAIKTASEFEASLKAHSRVLEEIKYKSENSDDADSLINEIENMESEILKSGIYSEEKELDDSEGKKDELYREKLKSAQEAVDEVRRIIEEKQEKLGREATVQAENNLELARQEIEKGKNRFEAGDYGASFSLFEKSKKIAKESKKLIEAKIELDADINIDIERADKK